MSYLSVTAREYISKVPSSLKTSEFPLTKMDSKMLESFQKDLPVFNGVKMPDIAFLTKNLDMFNLFRGCRWGCLHCPSSSLAPVRGRESIWWEDLKNLVFGFKVLNERLGFDVLNGNKFLNITEDSNPIDIAIKGKKKKHKVTEAMKLIYNHLGIPTVFKTSGWGEKGSAANMYSYNTAKNLVKMIKRQPDSVKEVKISVNPFMEVDDYVHRMARTIFMFLDLFRMNKASIDFKHAKDGYKGFDLNSARTLYNKIYEELQVISNSKLEGFPELKPDVVTKIHKLHWIEPKGRGQKFFPKETIYKQNRDLAEETEKWNNLAPEEQREILLNDASKRVDIDGSVYAVRPTRVIYGNTPSELTVPTGIQLNFEDKAKPNPVYSGFTELKNYYF